MTRQIFLFPGNLAVSAEPACITTLLGSCVAVALFDPVARVGGLNHYLLAEPPSPGEAPSLRHGSIAIPALIDALAKLGAEPQRLRAKVYGGANVVSDLAIGRGVGEANIAKAKELLARFRIPIVEENTGGTSGRRIRLDTATFEVTQRDGEGESTVPEQAQAIKGKKAVS